MSRYFVLGVGCALFSFTTSWALPEIKCKKSLEDFLPPQKPYRVHYLDTYYQGLLRLLNEGEKKIQLDDIEGRGDMIRELDHKGLKGTEYVYESFRLEALLLELKQYDCEPLYIVRDFKKISAATTRIFKDATEYFVRAQNYYESGLSKKQFAVALYWADWLYTEHEVKEDSFAETFGNYLAGGALGLVAKAEALKNKMKKKPSVPGFP